MLAVFVWLIGGIIFAALMIPPVWMWILIEPRQSRLGRAVNLTLAIGGAAAFVVIALLLPWGMTLWHILLAAAYGVFAPLDVLPFLLLVALFIRCTHLCCWSSWHLFTDPAPLRDYATYGADPPTWTHFGQDPIYCICHGAQYDPLLLVHDINPTNDVGFIGAQVVHGPAAFAMPVIPLRAVNDVLYGGMADPRWYDFCERLPPGGM